LSFFSPHYFFSFCAPGGKKIQTATAFLRRLRPIPLMEGRRALKVDWLADLLGRKQKERKMV